MNDNCNLCNNSTIRFGKSFNYLRNDKINWEHDSIIELLKLDKANVYFTFCIKCLHVRLMPEFSNKNLYKENGFLIRKKKFEEYFTDKIYENEFKKIDKNYKFKISSEYERLAKYTNVVASEYLGSKSYKEKKLIKILDYGGGDGYISNSIKNLLEAIYNFKISVDIYNPSEKEQNKKNIIDKKYDIIILSHVLEHVHFLDEFLEELTPYTDQETKIIAEVPDERFKLLKVLTKFRKNHLEAHVNYFSKFSISKLFEKFNYYGSASYQSTSYRGQKMMTIFGVYEQRNAKKYYRLNEIFHLILFFFSCLIYKFKK